MKTAINTTKTQYRVAFTCPELVNGNIANVGHSTIWYDSREVAESSQWMKCDNARIVTRELQIVNGRPQSSKIN